MNSSCQTRIGCSKRFPLSVVALALLLSAAMGGRAQALRAETATPDLPDAPSELLVLAGGGGQEGMQKPISIPPPCPLVATYNPFSKTRVSTPASPPQPGGCINEHALRIVVNEEVRQSLTVRQKGLLAFRDVTSVSNLLVIAAEAGAGIGANSHSAYGPGLKGFGRLTGYQLLQDTQGEFFGTFLIPALVHEDPRYRRMQNATPMRRVLHALSRTVVAQHDDGRRMVNYATLLTYPISAELSNLYVPGVQGNGGATARRIAIGFATDPISNLIAEFVPDLARRIHVRSVFVQQIVNNMALSPEVGVIQ